MPVVCGVDDSPVSRLVATRAIEQARWRETDLHVVHVFHLPTVFTEAAIDWAQVAQTQRDALWASLDGLLSVADVRVERVDLEGYPPETLVGYATDVDASMMIVGTRGRGDFASLILGSTSHRTIHLAKCDVLVVKAVEDWE